MTSPSAVTGIPLVIVEEHHEVFWIWHHSILRGWLAETGNTLVHVDEHSDMSLPRLRRPLSSISNERDLLTFTYNELDIGNFIWPAVYQGIFSRIHWMRSVHTNPVWKAMRICAKTPDAYEFITASSFANTRYTDAPDQRTVEYSTITSEDSSVVSPLWALDIDLDYFCCNSFPDFRNEQLEITKGSYQAISENPYHFLRIAPGSKITFEERTGRYFLQFNHFPNQPSPEYDFTNVEPRLAKLSNWLRQANSPPQLITICRSVYSGYTPVRKVDQLQQLVLAKLRELWDINNHSYILQGGLQLLQSCKQL